ncbi:MAG: two-component regulator propeller domain-containing protein [Spirosomataceae bacterium]
MSSRLVRLWIAMCVLQPLGLLAQIATLSFQHLSIEQGLSNSYITCITQDNYGFVWIGTASGLNRFDGVRCVQYTHLPGKYNSLSHKLIRSVLKSHDGTMWVGTQRGLNRFDASTQTFKRYFFDPLGDGCNHIRCLAEDASGMLWLGTNNGVVAFNPKTEKSYLLHLPTDLISKPSVYNIRCLLPDGNTLWVGTQLGLYAYNIKDKGFEVHCQSEELGSLPDNYISSLAKNPKTGQLLVGTRKGMLLAMNQEEGTFMSLPLKVGENLAISSILFAHDGSLWVSSQGGGMLKYLPVQQRFIAYMSNENDPYSIRSNMLKQLFQDKGGVIWAISTDGGVSRCNPFVNKFNEVFSEINYRPQSTLGTDVSGLSIDPQHHLWFASRDGLIKVNRQTDSYEIYKKETHGLSDNYLFDVCADRTGKIWVGTNEFLNRLDPVTKKVEVFPYLPAKETPTDYPPFNPQARNFIAGFQVFCIREAPDGRIFIGTSEKLNIYDPATNSFSNRFNDQRINRLPGKNYNTLYIDSKGNLWVGSIDGMIKVSADLAHFIVYKHNDDDSNSLPDDGVVSFAEDAQGNMWIGTDEGLSYFNQKANKFTNFFKEHGLPFNGCPSLKLVGNQLWIGTGFGLACMDVRTHKITTFDRADGLRASEFETSSLAKDSQTGELFMGATRGVVYFDPRQVTQNHFVPSVYLTSFKVAGNELIQGIIPSEEQVVELNHDQNYFSFGMAALSFDHPEGNQYMYRLEDFDNKWVVAGSQAFASYTNIPPGEYKLRIRGSNNDGVWSKKDFVLPIVIKPPFWQTWWFRFIILLELITWGVYLYQQRLRLIQREHETELRLVKEQQLLQEKLNLELAEKLDYQQKYEAAQKHQVEVERKSLLLEREKAMAKYQNLVNQLNPHFLFNSLAVLDSLIFKEQKLASKYLRQLTKVYRYLIENDENEAVTLEQEKRFAQDFIGLLHTRYGKGLEVTVNVPEQFNEKKIVPVTFQNLIENAIKHNTTDAESPLQIRIFVENDYLVVENNLQKRPFVSTSNKKGLLDFQMLYSYLTTKQVVIKETEDAFRVAVPLLL